MNRLIVMLLTAFALFGIMICDVRAGSEARDKSIDTISEVPRGVKLALFECQEHMDRGEFEAGARLLFNFLKEHSDEDHFYIRFFLGNCLAQSGSSEEALVQYEAAVAMEARFEQGWLNLGETAYNLGRYGLAAKAIHTGYLLSADKRPQVLYFAAVAFIMDYQHVKAVELLETLIAQEKDGLKLEYFRALISACVDLHDVRKGREAVNRMLAHFPENADAWLLAYQYAACTEDFQRAAIALTVTGYLRPLTRDEALQLGDFYNIINVPAQASSYYEEAITDSSASTREFERLASSYLAAHDTERALDTLKRAIAKEPTYKLWSLLGDLYCMEKQYEEAFNAFKQCAEMDESKGRPFLMMGYCALELGLIQDAVVNLAIAEKYPGEQEMARALLKRAETKK